MTGSFGKGTFSVVVLIYSVKHLNTLSVEGGALWGGQEVWPCWKN